MPSFCAGFIKSVEIKGSISNSVYYRVKKELDSQAIKVSAQKTNGGVNYIAFLSKTKLIQENVLRAVGKIKTKSVVVFELDYKKVGVVCENGKVIDYILDGAVMYAKSNKLKAYLVSNTKGNRLYTHNITKDKKKSKYAFATYTFLVTSIILVALSGYYYTKELDINIKNRTALHNQYVKLVRENFDKSMLKVKNIDFVQNLNKIEEFCYQNSITLNKVFVNNNQLCISLSGAVGDSVMGTFKVKKSDNRTKEVIYCSEKI
jgi:hypothetical protein